MCARRTVAYLSDPDVFFLRDDNIRLTEEEKYTLATVNSLFGGVLLCSDNMGRYTPEARELYERLLKNRDARNIRVTNNAGGLSVAYDLDGTDELLRTVE